MVPLSMQDIDCFKTSSIPLPVGVAPPTSSESFKSPHAKLKEESRQLHHHLSVEGRNVRGSQMKRTAAPGDARGAVRLGVGRPNAELYPWSSVSFVASPAAQRIKAAQSHAVAPRKHGYDTATALNYGNAVGSPPLVRFLTEHMEMVHDPPYCDWALCVTSGSTSALNVALRVFCNVGDTVLSERFTYPGFRDVAALIGVGIHGIDMDSSGLRSDHLDKVLNTWDLSHGRKPRLLYMVPCGQNPTGCTQTAERRNAIYDTAEKHDLIILEDDPYFFLNLTSFANESNGQEGSLGLNDYLKSLAPSYLSIDRRGRVVRLDSAAKILSPGLRVGWVTASSWIIDKFIAYNETDAVAASGPSQLMLCNLLEQSWGHRGFMCWLADLSSIYRHRRDIMQRALHEYLPPRLCRWIIPQCGMFFWLRIDIGHHSTLHSMNSQPERICFSRALEIEAEILTNAMEHGVHITKGSLFAVDRVSQNEIYLRLTYAAAAESELEEGVQVVAEAIKKAVGLM